MCVDIVSFTNTFSEQVTNDNSFVLVDISAPSATVNLGGLSGFTTRFGDREEETVKTLIETHTSNPDVCRKPGLDSVYSSENMMRFAEKSANPNFANASAPAGGTSDGA